MTHPHLHSQSAPKRPPDLERAVFRSRPDHDLVPLESLPSAEQRLLLGPRPDGQLFGLLHSRSSGSRHLLDQDSARLIASLRSAHSPDAMESPRPGVRVLARLVLDGILEMETEDGFVAGPPSLPYIVGVEPIEPRDHLARRSLEALRYGERLALSNPTALSARLYRFGRLPAVPTAQCRPFRIEQSLRRHLRRHWRERPDESGSHWRVWLPRETDRASAADSFKLYVSPHPRALEPAFTSLVEAMTETGPRAFKVVRDAADAVRADKLVVYLPNRQCVRRLADALVPKLAGIPAQGVPFTAALDDVGLLSWGPEPPWAEQTQPWLQSESWRLWLTNRFALALVAARRSGGAVEGWRFAAERLRLEGLDPTTFQPDEGLWQA